MLVEFIGSTGAGKTSLLSRVQDKLSRKTSVTTSFDIIASQAGLQYIQHPTARNIIQEVLGLPYLIRSLPRNKASVDFSLRMLGHRTHTTTSLVSNLRSLIRKFGVYEFSRRKHHNIVILVDEGTVHLSHILFVYDDARFCQEEIIEFARLVPLPDYIVYVRAPLDCLIARTLNRVDPPREMRSRDRNEIASYLSDAVEMFDQLVASEKMRDRVLVVENSDFGQGQFEELVDRIVESILACQRAFDQRSEPGVPALSLALTDK
jgi:deoxyadenosine/deoxycytidine kinase